MNPSATEQCNRCRFWLADPKSPEFDDEPFARGSCRRYPPKLSDHMAAITIGMPRFGELSDPGDVADSSSVFEACLLPVTFCDDWCGEYQSNNREGC